MKLFYSPASCALGVHILMEEVGTPFQLHRVNFAEREQYSDAYKAISPKAKVPALQRDDGSVLTEYQAISLYLAMTRPERLLIPSDPERFARMMEALEFVVGTIHANGFRKIFRPGYFAPSEADHAAVKVDGARIANEGFGILEGALAGRDWLAGDFSIADPALFYVSYWAVDRVKSGLPPNVLRHYERMRGRQSVQRALAEEGL